MKLSFLKTFGFLLIFSFFFSINVFAANSSSGNESKPSAPVPAPETKGQPSEERSDRRQPADLANQEQDKKSSKDLFTGSTFEDFEPREDFQVFDENYLGSSAIIPATDKTVIDPGAISLIQSTFLGNLNVAFSTVAKYALKLLYLFAVFEVVIFGFIWALQRDVGWSKLFFKIIKISLIFFIIQNYTWLLDTVMQSFAQLAGVVINNNAVAKYVFNPAKIWQYGYNSGVHLLQLATLSNNIGLAMVQLSLGMGILMVFGLLGIQMVLQMVGFYSVALGALILLPFGAFVLGRGMFDKAVQSVLQAGIRLMVLITIIGIAIVVWDGFQLADLATTTKFNINQPLGLFFTSLLFLCLAFYLPKVLSQAVGSFGGGISEGESPSVVVHEAGAPAVVISGSGGAGDMQAATAIEAAGATTGGGYEGAGVIAAQSVSMLATPTSGLGETKVSKGELARASYLSKSISESTVKKIKETVLRAAKKE